MSEMSATPAIRPHLSIEEMDNQINDSLKELKSLLAERQKMIDAEATGVLYIKAEITTRFNSLGIIVWAHGEKACSGMGRSVAEAIDDYISQTLY